MMSAGNLEIFAFGRLKFSQFFKYSARVYNFSIFVGEYPSTIDSVLDVLELKEEFSFSSSFYWNFC